MKDVYAAQIEAQEKLLDVFAESAKLPIGLFPIRDGAIQQGIYSPCSQANYAKHCDYIQQLPGGMDRCLADERQRAAQTVKTGKAGMCLCWSGMNNLHVPIIVNGKPRAVLLTGELRSPEMEDESLAKHESAVKELGLNEEQAGKLLQLLYDAEPYSKEKMEDIQKRLLSVVEALHVLIDEQDKARQSVQIAFHDIQTQLTAIRSAAALLEDATLLEDVKAGNIDIVRELASKIHRRVHHLNTIVRTQGDFMERYDFTSEPVGGLLAEAIYLYEDLAKSRGISVELDLTSNPGIDVSKSHLQLALNNLMHNALKYSFRSGPTRQRFIKVSGTALLSPPDMYKITFENYGVGILPEEIATQSIFEDGYQGKLTKYENRTGSGKGLFFVRNVVRRHHGYIVARSLLVSDGLEQREGQPHRNQFEVILPYTQGGRSPLFNERENIGGGCCGEDDRVD